MCATEQNPEKMLCIIDNTIENVRDRTVFKMES